jgi:hypothetical protein
MNRLDIIASRLFVTWEMDIIYRYSYFNISISRAVGVPRGAVGSGTVLQAGRSQVRFQMVSLEFFLPAGL